MEIIREFWVECKKEERKKEIMLRIARTKTHFHINFVSTNGGRIAKQLKQPILRHKWCYGNGYNLLTSIKVRSFAKVT